MTHETQSVADCPGKPAEAIRIQTLIQRLGAPEATERQAARRRLERAGHEAVPYLIRALGDHRKQVRWEAGKALGTIADPISANALVKLLEDRDPDVRWLAAVGLSAMRRDALEPLLNALLDRPDSDFLRQGAHHVCHDLARRYRDPEANRILKALDESEPDLRLPVVAYRTLQALRKSSHESKRRRDPAGQN